MRRYLKENKLTFILAVILATLSALSTAGISLVLQKIIDIATTGNLNSFFQFLFFTLLFLVILGVIRYAHSVVSKYLIQSISKSMRSKIFYGLMNRQPQNFFSINTADYISSLTNDIKLIEDNYMTPLLQMIEFSIMFIATLIILITLSPIVTIFLIFGMLLLLIIPSLLGKKLEKHQQIVSKQLSLFTTKIKDIFSGYEVIRSFQVLSNFENKFQQDNESLSNSKLKYDCLFSLNQSICEILAVSCTILVIFMSAYLLLIGQITMGTVLALTQLSGTFMSPITIIMGCIPQIKSCKPIIKRLNELAEFTNESEVLSPTFKEQISLNDLSFSYKENHMILNSINLNIQKGKKYAIIGKSGCGKSTLIKLLNAYFTDYQGAIKFDQTELKSISHSKLTQLMSIIHQNVYMFDSSIKDNIALLENFSAEEWEYALQISGLSQFLNHLKDGLDTSIGENGSTLSGGQRQRIALARAFIRKTPIIILDEGTSAIDKQTAIEIESKLLNQDDLTLITITHMMSPQLLSQYDEIIFMENGAILEQGRFEKLQNNKQDFYNFYNFTPQI